MNKTKVSNLINFYNRTPTDYPDSFQEMLKKHGRENITAISIVRTPLLNTVYDLEDSSYDKFYHLKLIINHKYSIKKENIIKFDKNDIIPPDSEVIHLKFSEIPQNLTIKMFCENCKLHMGTKMFSYDAKNNNSQLFVYYLLSSSNINTYDEFVLQDIKSIRKDLALWRKRINSVTKLGAGVNLKRPKPPLNRLTTMSDNDIVIMCHTLKIPLEGVFMKDELRAPLKVGNYVMNLQNHDQGGSHWVAFVKHRDNIYYHDSFGVIMPQNEYDIFVSEHDNIYYNTQQKQDLEATSCGYWCIYFLYTMHNSKGSMFNRFSAFNKLFKKTNTTRQNEQNLLDFMKQLSSEKKLSI